MRAIVLGIAVLLAPVAGCVTALVKVQQPTNVAFAANNENGMLVVAENGGTAYAPGRYRFVRIDRETRRVLNHVDIEVGAVRGQVLFGQRPGSVEATHAFHYAVVPAGDYALVYLDSSADNTVTVTDRWTCLSNGAPIYNVGPGAIAVVRAPDRIPYDIYRDNGVARRALLKRLPPGTTLEHLRSEEKAAQDFAEIAATNPLLTAPHRIASPAGALVFQAPERAGSGQCHPVEASSITPPQ